MFSSLLPQWNSEVSTVAWKIEWLKLYTKDCIAARDIAVHKMLWTIHSRMCTVRSSSHVHPSMHWEWCLPRGCLPGGVCLGGRRGLPRGCLPGEVRPGGVCPGGTEADTPLCEKNDWQTVVKTLPCRNYVADGNKLYWLLCSCFQVGVLFRRRVLYLRLGRHRGEHLPLHQTLHSPGGHVTHHTWPRQERGLRVQQNRGPRVRKPSRTSQYRPMRNRLAKRFWR